jgi:hypothetical protein
LGVVFVEGVAAAVAGEVDGYGGVIPLPVSGLGPYVAPEEAGVWVACREYEVSDSAGE